MSIPESLSKQNNGRLIITGVFKDKNVLDKCSYMLKQLALEIRPDFMLVCEQELKLDFTCCRHMKCVRTPCVVVSM